jgi:hypothetical protein
MKFLRGWSMEICDDERTTPLRSRRTGKMKGSIARSYFWFYMYL